MSSSDKELNFLSVIAYPKAPTKPNVDSEAWTSGGKMWLKDFLPSKMPQARIMMYGYDAIPAFRKSREGIQEWVAEPDRPLIFVCHSLGGIVVKRAMTEARQNERYKAIYDATYGMAFFGTPHNGSKLASLASVVANVFSVVLRNPQPSFMEALKRNSLFADVIRDDFRHGLEKFHVLSYYETIPPENMTGLVVDKKSAVLGLPSSQETPISLAGKDHSALCKFDNEEASDCKKVMFGISKLCAAAVAARLRLAEEAKALADLQELRAPSAEPTTKEGNRDCT
ncbi:hypothetical protein CTAM01_03684 [Colletotrichum tamarilloi]|uniref:DUF676 domain-containing protein n=1 Tax=Colletotrichum tamarilloi TaxID=1209934 RepID=A0ABQ9RKG1_9PEZI|nr:uncharacterized protein CTAM01_03684 [Colletotrichum tamarilloi]KAK1506349.1 hypothetical protein CTAM01_03684 [Colletotrichum tamarilloi]